MKGIILAAGKGNRLGLSTPKCLQIIGHKTLMQRQLDALSAQDVRDLVCVVGYQKEFVAEAVKKMWPHKVTFVENDSYEQTNTSYSLYLARAYMDDDFFYMNADVAFRPDLLARLVTVDGDAALAIQHKKCGAEEVKVIVNGSRVMKIGKDLDPSKCLGEFIGVALFRKSINPRFIDALSQMMKEGRRMDYFEGALQKICVNTSINAVDITDIPCIEIDFPEDLEQANKNASSFDADNQKKSLRVKIKEARKIAQAPRIAKGEDWYSQFFTRYFTMYISYFIWRLGISANTVTVWMGIVCLLGSICIVFDNVWLVLLGGLLWQLWYILDCVDGEVARLCGKTSQLGVFIDLLTHIYVNPTIPLAFGLHIFVREQTFANAVCAFLLYSTFIWKSSMLKARTQLDNENIVFKPAQQNKMMPLGLFRFIITQPFNVIGQMIILPLILILSYIVKYEFISDFLIVYTSCFICYLILLTTREIILVQKLDSEK
jgi:choline kinase/phosphatidylglycerophosphate synthase